MESTRPIRALMRGLDALTFLNLRDGATVSEVAQEIRLPRTTVYRILETLCTTGFVFRDAADDRYRLTILVRGLSDGFDDEAWGYSAGFRAPLLTTAPGRVYLANSPAPQRETLIDILARSNKEEDKPARSRVELQRMLADIKASGWATATRSRRLAEEVSLSVPVLLHDRVLASLTVRFAASAVPLKVALERFLPKLRQCAARISSLFSEQQAEARVKAETTA